MTTPSLLAPILGRTMVLVAHPDDESITCGGLLQRMRKPFVVFATDGAPEDEYFWGKHGSRAAYSRLRQEEARTALGHVGVSEVEFLAEQTSGAVRLEDQKLFRALPVALELLRSVIKNKRPDAILTLAYEGGHPDHDSCSFLSAQLGREFGFPIWEAPLYHRRADGSGVYQRFVREKDEVIEFGVAGEMLAGKQRMLQCYKSQFDALSHFEPECERFRPQSRYEYAQPPHEGKTNYEVWQWAMTAKDVSQAFASALAASKQAQSCQSAVPETK